METNLDKQLGEQVNKEVSGEFLLKDNGNIEEKDNQEFRKYLEGKYDGGQNNGNVKENNSEIEKKQNNVQKSDNQYQQQTNNEQQGITKQQENQQLTENQPIKDIQSEIPIQTNNQLLQQQIPIQPINQVKQQEIPIQRNNQIKQQQIPLLITNQVNQQKMPFLINNEVNQQEIPFMINNEVYQQQIPAQTNNQVKQVEIPLPTNNQVNQQQKQPIQNIQQYIPIKTENSADQQIKLNQQDNQLVPNTEVPSQQKQLNNNTNDQTNQNPEPPTVPPQTSSIAEPLNQQINALKYENYNFDDLPADTQIQQVYEALLTKYVKLKQEVAQFKQINISFERHKQDTLMEDQLLELISHEKQQRENLQQRYQQQHQQLESVVIAKQDKLERVKCLYELEETRKQMEIVQQEIVELSHNNIYKMSQSEEMEDLTRSDDEEILAKIQELKREEEEVRSKAEECKREFDLVVEEEQKSKELEEKYQKQCQKLENQIGQKKIYIVQIEQRIKTLKQILITTVRERIITTQKQTEFRKQLQKSQELQNTLKTSISTLLSEKKEIEQRKSLRRDKKAQKSQQESVLQQNKSLESDIKWQQKKMQDFLRKKQTYVEPSILSKLIERKRQQQMLNQKIGNKQRIYQSSEKQLKQLYISVDKLQKQDKRILGEKQLQLSQIRSKTKQLRKKKQERQKILGDQKIKLQEYKNEYPNYQNDKAKAIEDERLRKVEEKKRKQEEAKLVKQKEKEKLKEKQKQKDKSKVGNKQEEGDVEELEKQSAQDNKIGKLLRKNCNVQCTLLVILIIIILISLHALRKQLL